MRERPSPQPEEPKAAPPKKGLLKKLSESSMAKPLLVAGILHLPLNPEVNAVMKAAAHEASEAVSSPWERENMVLQPQSKETMAAVVARSSERESRIDTSARANYMVESEQQLEAGKGPSFADMEFALERLNGIPSSEVDAAEKKADALVKKFSAEVGGDLSEEEITRISTEMYGADDNAEWGQASMTRYFNGGKRNCVGISRAQSVVFEGVLAHLPEEQRKHWKQSTQFVKQHEIAGLEHLDDQGKRDTLYLLEGKYSRTWKGVEDEPGTATLPMEVIKRALVSSSPIEAKAAGKPGEVAKSATLKFASDQPVGLNVHIDGMLKAAEFNIRQAAREKLEPRKMTEAEIADFAAQEERIKDDVMEITLLDETGTDQAQEMLNKGMEVTRIDRATKKSVTYSDPRQIDARDLVKPTKEAVAVFNTPLLNENAGAFCVNYGTMKDWPQDAIVQALKNRVKGISVKTLEDGHLSAEFLKGYAEAATPAERGVVVPETIKIVDGGPNEGRKHNIDLTELKQLFTPDQARIIDISEMGIADVAELAKVLKDVPADNTVVLPSGPDYVGPHQPDLYKEIGSPMGKIMLPHDTYGVIAARHPEMLDNPHYAFNSGSSAAELSALSKIVELVSPNHPMLAAIDSMVDIAKDAEASGDLEETAPYDARDLPSFAQSEEGMAGK